LLSARLWRSAGNYDRALKCLEKAEKVARELKDEKFFTASFHIHTRSSVKVPANRPGIAQSRLAHAKTRKTLALQFPGICPCDHNRDLPEAEKLIRESRGRGTGKYSLS